MNKWLLIPDECFTVGRLRLPGFRFKTTKKIKDIWGPLKKEVRSTVLKKWLKYTQILFPSVNCHRIVIANASAAVMASGVDQGLMNLAVGLWSVTSVVRKEPERVFVVKRNSLDVVGLASAHSLWPETSLAQRAWTLHHSALGPVRCWGVPSRWKGSFSAAVG